jgi:hypothetical protein
MNLSEPEPVVMNKYHTGKGRTSRKVDHETREFVAWDGEGVNLAGSGKPQSYVLFGSNKDCVIDPNGLSTFECLDHILDTGKRFPGAIHVGFAFTYDANMIIGSLTPTTLARLHKHGFTRIKRKSTGDTYVITFRSP